MVTVNKSNNQQPVGEEISSLDVQRVLEHAQSINLSSDRRILHVLTQEYKVDDRSGIKSPLGLSGHRLEAKVHLVTSAWQPSKVHTSGVRFASGREFHGFASCRRPVKSTV